MDFEILGEITDIETIAVGRSIRELQRLRKVYGAGRWRKRKGMLESVSEVAKSGWQNYTGMKRMASGERCQAKTVSGLMEQRKRKNVQPRFVVCVNNADYEASLELHKIYSALPDSDAAKAGD